MTNYYEAVEKDGGWCAHIYDENDATIYRSEPVYDTEPEAIDAAGEWAEDNDIDVQMAGA